MNRSELQVFHLARITLQTETPLSIATGKADGVFDTSLVTDANGLPTIPGTSLTGVLRHLYQDEFGEAGANELFGFQSRDKSDESQPSRLHVSWGCIHNSAGKAVQGLCLGKERTAQEQDTILKVALALADIPANRDRVRINHKGASSDTGKFDRAVLPAGYRFSVELSLWSDLANDAQWERVLDLLQHPLFRLGGSTRAGLGKLKVVSVHTLVNDLRIPAGRTAFGQMRRDMNNLTGFKPHTLKNSWAEGKEPTTVTATLKLKPKSYWRIGQGDKPTLTDNGKTADLLPKLEARIGWNPQNQATVETEKLLVPASSVKGALAHRIAFHANRLSKTPRWADDILDEQSEQYQKDYDKSVHCDEVKQLFGFANDSNDNKQEGEAGRVLIDDAYREFSAQDLQIIMHNSIDRFSGSVRDHMLFSEEMVWGKGIDLQLTVKKHDSISVTAKQALQQALLDLCEGRLALGASVSKGHGFFSGTLEWSDNGKWIGGAI
jgi:CRISPR/Cas system CSM-associated protein Csm3 (group 7 of RAMP superfamily)